MMFGFTLYTFFAAKRGHDFSFLGSFLFGSLSIIILFSLIQILFPYGIPLQTLSHIFDCFVANLYLTQTTLSSRSTPMINTLRLLSPCI
ncbi:hypothetical protein QL285_048491 [Trifolium repens]|nr:hypothetical protein QL285_048491 [Trifolium repens]